MCRRLKHWLPEIALAIVALFFTYRELGTFPGSWVDEGLFIMTAKMLAGGHGYAIPLLGHLWPFPYFLAVGPTVIVPAAISLKLFGLSSIAAARLPMTLYILAICFLNYVFTKKIAGLSAARWSTALLVTLSAFINTGKPVLGEVPAYFFLLLGLFLVVIGQDRKANDRHALIGSVKVGILFGLSILSKLTYGLILPALGVAWLIAVFRRQWKEAGLLTISGIVALCTYLPWRLVETLHTPGGSLSEEVNKFVLGGGDLPIFNVLLNNRELLLRIPFLAFGLMLVLGLLGLWSSRVQVSRSVRIVITTIVVLFTAYFLNSYGWYRHLLPAHLLLLPFVPVGLRIVVDTVTRPFIKKTTHWFACILLMVIVIAQAFWQFDHRGSGSGVASAQAAAILQEHYANMDLLIEESELFAQLPENPHWVYLPRDKVSLTMPKMFETPDAVQHCFQHIRKLNEEELQTYGAAAIPVSNYHLIPAPVDCK